MDKNLQQLIEADKDFSKMSREKGAAVAFAYYLTDNAIQLPNNKLPIFGKKNYYEAVKKPKNKDILSWHPKGGKVSQSVDLGYTWGIYILTTTGGEKIKGKYLNIWVKQKDGSWKVAVDMGNSNS
jgi:ketosteroid isomerase-like protein